VSAGLQVQVLGLGVLGPGLSGWAQARGVLRGEAPYTRAATVVPPPQLLPATERRRAGTIIKVSVVVADEALVASGLAAEGVATVFSASEGDGNNCHDLCEALATRERFVSPTRFTNSVHNAPAGYWHIATHSMAASTSLCGFDAGFSVGLMEAAVQAVHGDAPVLLVVADAPYPEPLNGARPLPDAMGIAMLLAGKTAGSGRSLGTLQLSHVAKATPSHCDHAALDQLTHQLPVARGLPLLRALAWAVSSEVTLPCHHDLLVRARYLPPPPP
jgi:Beta-ketoacyl synthase, N-terminal domain